GLRALAIASFAAAAYAAPYVPKDDATVLERLPVRPGDPVARELRQLRTELAANPRKRETAVRLAERYFELATSEGDPRYVGYAQAALKPWWDLPAPPLDVLVMRAVLKQYSHDFSGAMRDLEAATREDPKNARVPPEVKVWVLTRLAEMSLRQGDVKQAEEHFRAGYFEPINDQFLLAAYADFLLDQGRPGEVIPLLVDWVKSDILLLRLALAEQALKSPKAREHIEALRSRFDAAALRGDKLHQQEEARFNLYLLGNKEKAL